MSDVGQKERRAQDRVIALFRDELGYEFLGNWKDELDNSNVDAELFRQNLSERGYEDGVITKALAILDKEKAIIGGSRNLYEANKAVYDRLRYGIPISSEAGEAPETVKLIDWEDPEANHFAIAEEVTVEGVHTKRPDLVLYVNGIALGVIELKRSLVNVTEGIRQQIGNQRADFIQPFFSTVQLLFAGNDVEGLRYGVIETREKYWLRWREDEDGFEESPLDKGLRQLCSKDRFLEVIHDYMAFDSGVKKTCRHNQYFAVKAAQPRVEDRDGGIIWHTQGSGKSLTMVWLAKWIREHQPDARVLLITDREELDEQIEGVFLGVNEAIYRTKSGSDLIAQLDSDEQWLICSLIHKFGSSASAESTEAFIQEVRSSLPDGFSPKGNFFVFVDECHRTQSGKMHEAMKEILPDAFFVGFTGTPLLKSDKRRSIETFGSYIHTYRFDEAVRDEVILDLRYEARDIDQELGSPQKVDEWFEAKTKGLNDLARAELKKRWGTMQKVLTSKSRAEKIVNDILLDMERQERLATGRGNAMLVSSSIYQACKFYEMFSKTSMKDRVAIVTSYRPNAGDISKEDAGEGESEALHQYEVYRQMLADFFDEPADQAVNRVEEFESKVKNRFVHEPGQMKLLIVVDKLLTGFDAPPATFLYIDKEMRDHGLFQAICRVNRLDSEDKEYGYIVDYKDLFKSIEGAYADYTSGALDGYDEEDVAGLLENRLEKGKEDLDRALEQIRTLCEPVEPPRGTLQYQHYFCAEDTSDAEALRENEPRRVELYKSVARLVRAYGAIANEMADAGYTATEAAEIKDAVRHYDKVRQEVKLGAGENIDYKAYEADMRYLLDTYIRAEDSVTVSTFDNESLVEILSREGSAATVDALPPDIQADETAVAETIENNTRKLIIDERPINPKYYDKMSDLLDDLIEQRRKEALEYKDYLAKLEQLAKKLVASDEDGYPAALTSAAQRALFDNLDRDEALAVELDEQIRATKKDGWRGHRFKEREVANAIRKKLAEAGREAETADVLELAKNQHEY